MKHLLKSLAEQSRFTLSVFNGALYLSGRILTPIEAQAAGLASKSLMAKLAEGLKAAEAPLEPNLSDSEDEDKSEAEILKRIQNLSAEDVLQFGSLQDKVICQVIDKASEDNESWEKIKIVPHEQMQNPDRNMLWVGVLTQTDKNSIFEASMVNLKGAGVSLGNFRQ